jgi:hypothetical protein
MPDLAVVVADLSAAAVITTDSAVAAYDLVAATDCTDSAVVANDDLAAATDLIWLWQQIIWLLQL